MQLYPVLNDLMQSMNKVSSTPVAMKIPTTPVALSFAQRQIKSVLELPHIHFAYPVDFPADRAAARRLLRQSEDEALDQQAAQDASKQRTG